LISRRKQQDEQKRCGKRKINQHGKLGKKEKKWT
jgi:hypothetical protein